MYDDTEEMGEIDALDAFMAGDGFVKNADTLGISAATTDADIEQIIRDLEKFNIEEFNCCLSGEQYLWDWLDVYRKALVRLRPDMDEEDVNEIVAENPVEISTWSCTAQESERRTRAANSQFADILYEKCQRL